MNSMPIIEADTLIPIIAIVGGFLIAIIGMISNTVRQNARVREREQSRREVAAYVAEGSMSAEDAERILKAGVKRSSGCDKDE